VYAGAAARLAAAEIAVLLAGVEADSIRTVTLGGVDHVAFRAPYAPGALSRLSSRFLCSARNSDGLLLPLELPEATVLDDDLLTIPKYQGKTNEQFTRLVLNLALAELAPQSRPYEILDPLCGRGTTLSAAWLLGHHGYGVEVDQKALEAHAAFLKTWLKRKRLKHTAGLTPVRRDGRSLGRRLDAKVTPTLQTEPLVLSIMPGDARDSAALWGKRRFDAIVTDAPYGVVHGSSQGGKRSRTAAGLLADAVPVWAGQLRPGGTMAIAWNTLGLPREDLVSILTAAGLIPYDEGPWRQFAHRVDSSIHRDVLVARLS